MAEREEESTTLVRYLAPGRRRAWLACRFDNLRVRTLAEQLERFRASDAPQFEHWFFQQFGSSFGEMRTLAAQVHFSRRLLAEIGDEVLVRQVPAHVAYRAVRIRHAGAARPDQVFDELGDSPITAQQAQAEGSFRVDELYEEENKDTTPTPDEDLGDFAEWVAEEATEPSAGMRPEQRLRTLYRNLARALHPDVRRTRARDAESDADELWLLVQQAYRNVDLPQLELLSGLLALREGCDDPLAACDLAAVKRELVRKVVNLRRAVERLERLPAWRFPEKIGKPRELARTARDVEKRLRQRRKDLRGELGSLEKQLAQLARPPRVTRRSVSPEADRQLTFDL